jgi:hypothetical protein
MAINPEIMCQGVYEPVCGCDGVTYPNGCEAGKYGASIDHDGECGTTSIVSGAPPGAGHQSARRDRE